MNKNTGLYCALFSLFLYVLLVVFVILRLPVKMDTLALLSWPIVPGIIGSLVFYRMDRSGSWEK